MKENKNKKFRHVSEHQRKVPTGPTEVGLQLPTLLKNLRHRMYLGACSRQNSHHTDFPPSFTFFIVSVNFPVFASLCSILIRSPQLNFTPPQWPWVHRGQMICRKSSYHAGRRWLVLEIEQEVPNHTSTTQRQDQLSPASFFPSLTPSAILSDLSILSACKLRLPSV